MLTTLLPGFTETTVTTGIALPTAMEFSPDGRLWTLEQGGNVKLVHSDGTTFTALHETVDSNGERGMLGIAFDPNFAVNHYVYLYYTNPSAGGASWAMGTHNQLSRFTVNDTNPLQPVFTNEAPILDWNSLVSATNHNGGAIHFGTDGMLYADAGDNTQMFTGPDNQSYRVSQSLATLLGKQLRIDVSKFNSGVAVRDDVAVGHLIPADNPFVGTATGINQLIYVLGLRNPFTFAVQPGTGRMLINDVGENTWEEIDDDIAGGNYGWSGGSTDGFGHSPPAFAVGTYHDPLLAYAHSGSASLATGSAIVGGTFYNPSTVQFPSMYTGMYFYEDLSSGWIRYFNPNAPNSASSPDGDSAPFASNTPGGLVDLTVDSAGNLYYLSGGDGSIRKISFTGVGTSRAVGQSIFYNNSFWDGNNSAANAADDASIATDKTAYLPGSGAATFANVSNYDKGINGVMVDLLGGGAHTSITLAGILNDFSFKVGNNNGPNSWTAAPNPIGLTVRPGAGVSGSDRVELIWADGAIQERWLEVNVRTTANTGLASNDVFFFGNEIGCTAASDTATVARVASADVTGAQTHGASLKNNIPVTNLYDFNKDGQVGAADVTDAQAHGTSLRTGLKFIMIGAQGPFAPDATEAAGSDDGVASGLAAAPPSSTAPAPPPWITDRLARLESDHEQIAQYFERLIREETVESREPLVNADPAADAPDLDDGLLDSLLAAAS